MKQRFGDQPSYAVGDKVLVYGFPMKANRIGGVGIVTKIVGSRYLVRFVSGGETSMIADGLRPATKSEIAKQDKIMEQENATQTPSFSSEMTEFGRMFVSTASELITKL